MYVSQTKKFTAVSSPIPLYNWCNLYTLDPNTKLGMDSHHNDITLLSSPRKGTSL